MEEKDFYMLSKIYEEMQEELSDIRKRIQELKEMMVSKQGRIDYKIEGDQVSLFKHYLVTREGIIEQEIKMDN